MTMQPPAPPPPPGSAPSGWGQQPATKPTSVPRIISAVVIGLVGVVVILVGIDVVFGSGPARPISSHGPRARVTVSGVGIMKSRRFWLSGDYEADWTAVEQDDRTPNVGCFNGLDLEGTQRDSISTSE